MLPCDLLTLVSYSSCRKPEWSPTESCTPGGNCATRFLREAGACYHVSCLGHCGRHKHIAVLNMSSFITQSCICAWYLS
jgi:hypothetical protein